MLLVEIFAFIVSSMTLGCGTCSFPQIGASADASEQCKQVTVQVLVDAWATQLALYGNSRCTYLIPGPDLRLIYTGAMVILAARDHVGAAHHQNHHPLKRVRMISATHVDFESSWEVVSRIQSRG